MSDAIQAIWATQFPTQDGETSIQSLAENTQYVVLYFYPKDNTPGCTTESIGFQANLENFTNNHAVVIGVSRDSATSHDKFACKYDLKFSLLADTESKICDAFDVIKEKNMFGKIGHGIERSTFILDTHGKILQEWRKVKVDGHVEEVLETIKSL